MNICILGFMGAGKSRYAYELAKLLNLEFIDLDEQIEKAVGQSISEIFNIRGEDFFRRKEQEELIGVLQKNNVVLASGGGTPAYKDNMKHILQKSISIYLKPDVTTIYNRLMTAQASRPLIANLDPSELKDFIVTKNKERSLFYRKSHFVINPEILKPDKMNEILKDLTMERFVQAGSNE
jgi:shikimate kinase